VLINNERYSRNSIGMLLVKFVTVLLLVLVVSWMLHNSWIKHLELYHTLLEVICVFVAFCIFVTVWHTYNHNSSKSSILNTSAAALGFGYLTVAIFDILHTFYFLKLDLTANSYFDLSTRYWILGRLSEALTLFLSTLYFKKIFNKWFILLITLSISLGVSYFVIAYHDALPVLLNDQGVTGIKIALEWVVITIFFISLYNISRRVNNSEEKIGYSYIGLAVMLSICSEFLFTLYNNVNSITWTMGHLLKITSYCFLFKGVFVRLVIYPYEKLEKTNEKLSSVTVTLNDLLDTLPIGVANFNVNGNLMFVNKKFEDLLACRRDTLYGLTEAELSKLFCYKPLLLPANNTVYENKSSNFVRTCKTLTGGYLKLSVKIQKVTNGYLALINDAKEEQALQNLHIQTETILNAVTNCIVMIDNNKKVVMCNKAMEELYETDRNTLMGYDIDELNRITDLDAKELPNLALSGSQEKQFFEVSLTSFKGNKKDLYLYLAPIKNIDGEIIGGISISTDVTELKKEQQKILQQEKLALLGQMGAAIVHETRNYLTTIKGRCQLINAFSQDDTIKKHALEINTEVDEVNRIISEFLFLSKPRGTELEEISLYDVFEGIKGLVQTTSMVRGVNVDFILSEEERYMLCDEAQLKQVILNICKNAVDAMADVQNSKLLVETGYYEESNEMFVKITDNGKGISDADLKKLGTPFFTTKETGTGLGLNVCYKIIQEHKGRIEVSSKLGIGTSFTVILPCIEDDEIEYAI
jgi:PAS domain S-box-containing protein